MSISDTWVSLTVSELHWKRQISIIHPVCTINRSKNNIDLFDSFPAHGCSAPNISKICHAGLWGEPKLPGLNQRVLRSAVLPVVLLSCIVQAEKAQIEDGEWQEASVIVDRGALAIGIDHVQDFNLRMIFGNIPYYH